MDDISNAELRNRLKRHGFESPPVTPTTRSVLLKKLRSLEQSSSFTQLSSAEEDNVDAENKEPNLRESSVFTGVNSPASKVRKVTSRFTYVSPINSKSNYASSRYSNSFNNDSHYYETGNGTDKREYVDHYIRHSTPYRSSDPPLIESASTNSPAVRKYALSLSWILKAGAFLIIGFACAYYYNATYNYQNSGIVDLSSLRCDYNQRPNVDCLPEFAIQVTVKVLDDIYQTLQEMAVTAYCNNDPKQAILSKDKLHTLLVRRHKCYHTEIAAALAGITMVADTYQNLSISVQEDGFIYTTPSLPLTCVTPKIVHTLFLYLFRILIGVAFVFVVLFLIRWMIKRGDEKKRAMEDLLTQIKDALKTHAVLYPDTPYLPITYINNQLISPQERQEKSKLWEKAVKLIEENESRIRKEIQSIKGEDYVVWRWLPKETSNPNGGSNDRKRNTWQGEAFGTTKGTINSPTVSPTPCLKIRHMFDPSEEGRTSDLLTELQNAILERCEGSQILHIAIDQSNPEGCIYVKCVSPEDAGNAYRKMHGAWFDGRIVSVKYIRLERYHQHFPESASVLVPLKLSKNL